MEEDKELSVMAAVNAVLAGLEQEVVARVLRWAADRYKVALTPASQRGTADKKITGSTEDPVEGVEEKAVVEFSELFASAGSPPADPDRVLVAAYWYQVENGQNELESQALNRELKNTGHGVSDMPRALNSLMNARPQLVIQLKKKGTTRQARRTFKLTTEGIKKVKAMLPRATE